MIKFIDDYDYFETGETWYTKESILLYCDGETEAIEFEVGCEVNIFWIERLSGYGMAFFEIEGFYSNLGLDELYSLVF